MATTATTATNPPPLSSEPELIPPIRSTRKAKQTFEFGKSLRSIVRWNSFDSATSTLDSPSNSTLSLSLASLPRIAQQKKTTSNSDAETLATALPAFTVPSTSTGEIVYGRDQRITKIFLNAEEMYDSIQLDCQLSPALASLNCLTILQLNNHSLTGSIPCQFSTLTNLKELSLEGNFLSGPLPDISCFPMSLEILNLSGNQFFAPIPPTIFTLVNLRYLNLSDNKITGRIPDEIGQLQLLENLDLSSNRMYGEIPKTIGQLKRLKVLQLQLNKFSGELPIELGNLPRIKSIYLNNNRFYGELNASIFEGLTTLSQLALNRNQFSGPFPTSFLSILRFRKLRLENNYFDTTPHWHEYPTHLKFSLRMGLKQYRFRPQKEGTPPQQILPDYTEFPEDTLHPSDTRRQSLGPLRTLYDLPDSVPLWTPEEVAFWVHTHGGPALVCELIQDLHIGGSQFFRLREDDLLSALGVRDEGVRRVLYSAMERVLAVANGIAPPVYEAVEAPRYEDR